MGVLWWTLKVPDVWWEDWMRPSDLILFSHDEQSEGHRGFYASLNGVLILLQDAI